ncbi:hypothetical protein BN2497_10687 [Janthinobacterium sp. CG23_2]|nr:hypothetical protein BN2497_10687 [Janthinobacterium sp. CG23_2]CUU31741.1 hypothetical protein BN3177_10687 [Janthinobacterium sp. CG23_2]
MCILNCTLVYHSALNHLVQRGILPCDVVRRYITQQNRCHWEVHRSPESD